MLQQPSVSDVQAGGVKVEERNLVIRHYSTAEVRVSKFVMWQGQHVKNFKRFRKVNQSVVSCNTV